MWYHFNNALLGRRLEVGFF